MSGTQMFEALEQRRLLTAYYGIDPFDASLTALFVDGTEDNDKIEIVPASSPGEIEVFFEGISIGDFAPTGRVVHGLGGNDSIKMDPSISRPTELSGDDGDDTLKGGGGDDVLTGRAGDDSIRGNGGRDLLLGGLGADTLNGNGGDDLLSAGYTGMDDISSTVGFRGFLNDMIEIWTDPGIEYEERIHLLYSEDHVGGTLLSGQNVFSDEDPDLLIGGAGLDVFVTWSIGPTDTIIMTPGEIAWFI